MENKRTEWEIYKVSLAGTIDPAETIFTPSITTWEDEFGQDLNGDNDFSGTASVSNYGNDTDGATLGKADGALYIRPEVGNDLLVNDSYLESKI